MEYSTDEAGGKYQGEEGENEKERRRKLRFAAFSLGPMSELFSRDSVYFIMPFIFK